MKSIVVILAEGDHDSAFIYRILKAHGATTFNRTIREYQYPLNNLFITGISRDSIDNLNIEVAGSKFLPYRVMKKGDNNTILIYTIGGDSNKAKRNFLVTTLNNFLKSEPDEYQVLTDTRVSVLYFFDADNIGIINRLN